MTNFSLSRSLIVSSLWFNAGASGVNNPGTISMGKHAIPMIALLGMTMLLYASTDGIAEDAQRLHVGRVDCRDGLAACADKFNDGLEQIFPRVNRFSVPLSGICLLTW